MHCILSIGKVSKTVSIYRFIDVIIPNTVYFNSPFTTNLPLQNLSSPVVSVDELFKSECPVAVLVNSLHIVKVVVTDSQFTKSEKLNPVHVRDSCHSLPKREKLKPAHIRDSCHNCHSCHSPPKGRN